jgi:hypothetical protein
MKESVPVVQLEQVLAKLEVERRKVQEKINQVRRQLRYMAMRRHWVEYTSGCVAGDASEDKLDKAVHRKVSAFKTLCLANAALQISRNIFPAHQEIVVRGFVLLPCVHSSNRPKYATSRQIASCCGGVLTHETAVLVWISRF